MIMKEERLDHLILPVEFPFDTTWPWNSMLISILSANKESLDWVYSNFINIECMENKQREGELFITYSIPDLFRMCPFIRLNSLKRNEVNVLSSGDTLNFLINCIYYKYYLFGIFDQSFFLENGSLHQTFIYGYNLKFRVFHVADFTFEGKYSFQQIEMDQIINGFNAVKQEQDYLPNQVALQLLQFVKFEYDLDPILIYHMLLNYLNGEREVGARQFFNADERYYGVRVYDKIIDFICLEMEKNVFDHKRLNFIYIHKIHLMNTFRRLKELTLIGNLIEQEWEGLINDALFIRNLYLKYTITKRDKTGFDIINKIKELKLREIDLIREVITDLNENIIKN